MIPVQITQLSTNKNPIHLTLDVGWVEKYKTVTGNPIVISDGVKDTLLKKLQMTLAPKQSGSGTPSPSNVRPISGWDEVETVVSGVNVWDEEWENGYYDINDGTKKADANRIRSKNYIPALPNTAYNFKTQNYHYVLEYDADHNYLRANSATSPNSHFTTGDSTRYITFYLISATTYNNDISINYPSTDTDYHAHQGHTYTTDLPQTVYGGTLDVVSGVLTVDRVAADMGSLNWYANGAITGGVQYAVTISDKKAGETNFICSAYETHTPSAELGYICGRASTSVVACNATQNNVNDFKTAVTGQTICYELATPTTIQCDPQTVSLLAGENVIMGDGDMEITYRVKASA